MDLKTLEKVDQLLDQRLVIKKSIENIDFSSFDCINVEFSHNIKNRTRIAKGLVEINVLVATAIYEGLVMEYDEISDKLEALGVELKRKKWVSADMKITIDGLKGHYENRSGGKMTLARVGPGSADDFSVGYDTEEKYK